MSDARDLPHRQSWRVTVFKGEGGGVYYQDGTRFFKLVLQIPPPPLARVEAPSSDEDEDEEEVEEKK